MSFPQYPEYKGSGVEWLGTVPTDWSVIPLKFLVSFRSGGTPDKGNSYFWNGNIPWVSARDLKVEVLEDSAIKITDEAINQRVASLHPSGSVVVLVRGMTLAKSFPVCLLSRPMAINQDLKALLCGDKVNNRYFAWLLRGSTLESQSRVDEAGHGTKVLRMEAWTSMQLPVPPVQDQKLIASFLDHETARIDTLVEEQQRLIALLKEKRQAVISHAVTKGLDPDVPMKDSGVEWLGEVPEHWVRKRLKNVSPFITVGIVVNPSSYLSKEGLPFIYGGEVKEGAINANEARKISPEDSHKNRKTMLEADDLVTMRVGYPGVTAVVPPECEGGNCASVMLTKKGRFDSRWLCAAMNSRLIRHQVEIVQYGAAQKQFNISDAVEFWLFQPPHHEQAEIANFIERESLRFDQLMDEAGRAQSLLHERRSALISAAVTGKIDVRGWTPPTDAAPAQQDARMEAV